MLKRTARAIRSVLPHRLRELASRIGDFLKPVAVGPASTPAPVYPSVENALRSLKVRGFNPLFAVDIGAYHGEWTAMFKNVFPASRVLMIEALSQKQERLETVTAQIGDTVDYRIAVLGPIAGQSVRFVEMETGSSVFEEQSAYERSASERITTTLDDVLVDELKAVDFLKLDVQGYELEVLRGGGSALAQAEAVLMEASLVPINNGAPLVADVVEFIRTKGFRLSDFCSQIRRRDGVLWQTDLLFLRTSSPWCQSRN